MIILMTQKKHFGWGGGSLNKIIQKAEYHMLTEADLYKKCDIQETESQQSAESNATSTVKFSSPPAAPLLRSRRIGSIRRRSPAAADQDSSRALRKAVSIACPDIQVLSLRSLSAEATIMAGMEKELLRFDEMAVSCRQCEKCVNDNITHRQNRYPRITSLEFWLYAVRRKQRRNGTQTRACLIRWFDFSTSLAPKSS